MRKQELSREIMGYIIENNVIYFCDFLTHTLKNEEEWFDLMCDDETALRMVVEYLESKLRVSKEGRLKDVAM